ncbi:Uncharacterized protein dnm_049420 [Desulfonema magnum]|uniref:Uncharacterized protein n=1 Tax=Desulfonema magnum TaxID=45655 RepID=A0A975BNV9_9BACT|nr:Uncharacterized protein dnm_049420 [Desulfonema magnum]
MFFCSWQVSFSEIFYLIYYGTGVKKQENISKKIMSQKIFYIQQFA